MSATESTRFRILAADDEQHVLDLFREFLVAPVDLHEGNRGKEFLEGGTVHHTLPAPTLATFDVTLCSQGNEAVEAVKAALAGDEPYAVAFLDVRLPPGPDGVWVAEQIRSLDPSIQIVMVTAYSDVNARELRQRVPPVDKLLYLQKPFYPEEIQQFAAALGAKWQHERELLTIQAELETRIGQRTCELMKANDQLKQEIEDRKRAEEALRESQGRLRFLSSHLLTAQERERRRISLELHDELGQALTFLKLQLRSIERNLSGEQEAVRKDCEHTLWCVDQVLENVRRLSRDLSPAILEDLGLLAALRRLVEDFARHNNIETALDMNDIHEPFSRDVQIGIFRIFQEALTNIAKHAEASRVSMVVLRQEDRVHFALEDDGRGFDVKQVTDKDPSESGLGLMAMEERARMLGGHLDIRSQKGDGTKITVTISRDNAGGG
jgi:signal transduction histidine kinase